MFRTKDYGGIAMAIGVSNFMFLYLSHRLYYWSCMEHFVPINFVSFTGITEQKLMSNLSQEFPSQGGAYGIVSHSIAFACCLLCRIKEHLGHVLVGFLRDLMHHSSLRMLQRAFVRNVKAKKLGSQHVLTTAVVVDSACSR